MTTTVRLGLNQPAPTDLVDVVTALNNNLAKLDDAAGTLITTALPSSPFSGKTVAVSAAGPVYRTYFSNGTAPASASFVELLNSSGTFGSTVKVATADGSSAATLATSADGTATTAVLILNPSSASKRAVDIRLAADSVSRVRIDQSAGSGSGTITFGNGTSADTNIYRSAANVLATDDSLQVGGDLKLVAGATIYRNQLSAVTTVANTVTETTVATMTIPASDAVVGAVYRIRAWGIASVTGTPTLTFRARIGATALGSSGARTASTGITNHAWTAEAVLVCISTGAGGTGFGNLATSETVSVAGAAGPLTPADIADGTATAAWATNTALAFTISLQWGTAAAANTATCQGFIAERVA